MYAQVILAKTSPFIDKLFTYIVPEEFKDSAKTGSQVIVEFGKRKAVGYIVGFVETCDIDQDHLNPI